MDTYKRGIGKDLQYLVARTYFQSINITYKKIGSMFGINEAKTRNYYMRWLKDIYRDFIQGKDEKIICQKYNLTSDELFTALRCAEQYKHIGLCYSNIMRVDGVIYVK